MLEELQVLHSEKHPNTIHGLPPYPILGFGILGLVHSCQFGCSREAAAQDRAAPELCCLKRQVWGKSGESMFNKPLMSQI